MTCWQFDVLGPLQAWRHHLPVPIDAANQRAVLALLLLQPGRVVTADGLIAGVWGDAPPPTARRTLQSLISRLRQALTPCTECPSGQQLLVSSPPGYLLHIPNERTDVHRFRELMALARTAAEHGHDARAASLLREALELWRGDALADLPRTATVEAEAVRLEEQRLAAVHDRIDADMRLGRHNEVLGELHALTTDQPLRERTWEQLMVALYRSGRQADALAAYQRVCRLLREEVGAEPAGGIRRVHAAILDHDPRLEVAPLL